MKRLVVQFLGGLAAVLMIAAAAHAGANPGVPFYGYGAIDPEPDYPIAGENAHITVTIGNSGDAPATNVKVRLSYNDWGVTFFGWQQIGEVTIPSIPAGGAEEADFDFVFENRAHTCLEAIIVSADENDNPNDDRGQINLEVINTGENFEYGIPVVNNGAAPLDLLLVPQCFGADGTAPGNHCQDLREMPLHLDPGEEFFFPVHLDLPPGTDMVLRLDAYQDMDLVNPHKHNYIDLHIRVATARELKGDALGTLADWAADASGGLRGKLNSAVRNLDNALADANWDEDDENVLTEAGGPSVFAAELAAANTLLGLLDSGLTADETDLINEVVLQLVDADRILADTAAAGDLAAAILIAQGDDQRLAGDYRGAMNTYKRAWQVATE